MAWAGKKLQPLAGGCRYANHMACFMIRAKCISAAMADKRVFCFALPFVYVCVCVCTLISAHLSVRLNERRVGEGLLVLRAPY